MAAERVSEPLIKRRGGLQLSTAVTLVSLAAERVSEPLIKRRGGLQLSTAVTLVSLIQFESLERDSRPSLFACAILTDLEHIKLRAYKTQYSVSASNYFSPPPRTVWCTLDWPPKTPSRRPQRTTSTCLPRTVYGHYALLRQISTRRLTRLVNQLKLWSPPS